MESQIRFGSWKNWLAKEGFDAVFDFTNQQSFNLSRQVLKKGGPLVTYAIYSSSLSIEKKSFSNFLSFGADFGMMMLKLAFWNKFRGKNAMFYGSSGRNRHFLEQIFGDLSVHIVAEHGALFKTKGNNEWALNEHYEENWKESIQPIPDIYAKRCPGAFVKEKETSLAWHYRMADDADITPTAGQGNCYGNLITTSSQSCIFS